MLMVVQIEFHIDKSQKITKNLGLLKERTI